ncbi:MAG: hypothetical protein EHM41_00865 [Chloroflexi bacterium]|nr:MAG: hypothetical protein EHM41_00865 [Chloroflexota bacterium]
MWRRCHERQKHEIKFYDNIGKSIFICSWMLNNPAVNPWPENVEASTIEILLWFDEQTPVCHDPKLCELLERLTVQKSIDVIYIRTSLHADELEVIGAPASVAAPILKFITCWMYK